MCSTFSITGDEVEQGRFLVVVDLCQEGHKVPFRGVLVKGRVVGCLICGLFSYLWRVYWHQENCNKNLFCPAACSRMRRVFPVPEGTGHVLLGGDICAIILISDILINF